jgi:hypothetical protein
MIAMSSFTARACFLMLVVAALGTVTNARAQSGMTFFAVTPCRLWDTRDPIGPRGGPKQSANTVRDYQVRELCGIPATAQAVAISVTIVAPTDTGNLRLYPAGTKLPLASVLNWLANDSPVANSTIIGLGNVNGSHLSVRVDMPPNSAGQVHTLADVTGYFQ